MWHTNDGMGWWMVFGGIWMLIFWGAIIWLIVWGAIRLGGGRATGRDSRDGESPLEIARTRYARGDITREQFEQLRHDLGG